MKKLLVITTLSLAALSAQAKDIVDTAIATSAVTVGHAGAYAPTRVELGI